jgi:hypothetical protein
MNIASLLSEAPDSARHHCRHAGDIEKIASAGTILFPFWSFICISVPSFVFVNAACQYFLAGKAGLFPIVYQGTGGEVLEIYVDVLPVLALSFTRSPPSYPLSCAAELIETLVLRVHAAGAPRKV